MNNSRLPNLKDDHTPLASMRRDSYIIAIPTILFQSQINWGYSKYNDSEIVRLIEIDRSVLVEKTGSDSNLIGMH